MNYFYVDGQGNRKGPFTVEQLNGYAQQGFLKPHMVLLDEQSNSHPAKSIIQFPPSQNISTAITCRNCGAPTSSRTARCPTCGIDHPDRANHIGFTIAASVVAVAFFAWLLFG